MSKLSPAVLDRVFAQLETAAVAGERCPLTAREGIDGLPDGATSALAKAGRIRIEVYAHNWRVVEIATGPNAGKRTMGPPNPKWRPYLIVGAGTIDQTRMSQAVAQPSAPRPLSRDELERNR